MVGLAPTAEAMPVPVTTRTVIGHSVQGRAIVAYHRYTLGQLGARPMLVVGQMHGDEETGKRVVAQLLARALPADVDLWIIPTVNPDGDVHNTRGNAHGIDLNRNFPVNWVKRAIGTRYSSGRKPVNQPETKAVRAFLLSVKPWRTVSFHNPLYGVDKSLQKDPSLARQLAAWSGYPLKSFTCNNGCHGTMTQFINAKTPGTGVTFEFGHSTPNARITRVVNAVLRLAQE
jgi:hypothetical protein